MGLGSKKYSDKEIVAYLEALKNSTIHTDAQVEFGFDTVEIKNNEMTLAVLHRTLVTQTDDKLRQEYIGLVNYLVHYTETYGGDAQKIKQMRDRVTAIEHYFDSHNKDLFVSLKSGRSALAHSADLHPKGEPTNKWESSLFITKGLED